MYLSQVGCMTCEIFIHTEIRSEANESQYGWMDDLRFYVLFNSVSAISGRCSDDNERLCANELRLWLRRFHLE